MALTSARLLRLLSLLLARQLWPGEMLAERLEVSPRTLRRDIDELRALGYHVQAVKGPDGGYRLTSGSELPPLLFDDEQAVAVAIALQGTSGAGPEIDEAARRALTTMRQVLPGRLRQRVDHLMAATISVTSGSDSAPVSLEVLDLVSAACATHVELRFDHVPVEPGPDPVPPRRRVEPHHVAYQHGRWYLVAWDLDRNDWRTFRLDRIVPRIPFGPSFTPRKVPGGDVGTFVAAHFRGALPGEDWPCKGEAILRKAGVDLAPYVEDGLLEPLPGDRCRLMLGSWSWPALAAHFLRFGADIEAVSPPALHEAFRELGDRCARAALAHAPDYPAI